MNGLRTAAVLFVLVLASACATVSTINPIGIANGEVMDGQLLGAWKFKAKDTVGKDEPAFAFVLSREPGKLAGLMIIPDDNEWWEAEVVVGKTGQYRVLNVKPLKKNGKPPEGSEKTDGYLPLRYEVAADGSINLFIWSEDSLKEAVEQRRISGTLGTSKINLTAAPSMLDAFFAETAPLIFSVPYATLEKGK